MWDRRDVPVLPESLILRGGKLVLRDWRESDAAALAPVCGDPEVCRFTSVPWTYTLSAARTWVQGLQNCRSVGGGLALAITRDDGEAALGNVNLVRFSADARQAALGYWLVPGARGQGLAVAAAEMLCAWGFEQMNLVRIEFAILPDNAASHRVADHLGAVREGLRRDSHEAGGRKWDMVIYSLSAPPAR